MNKKAEENQNITIDKEELQQQIDTRTQELDDLKNSTWADPAGRTLMAALVGAGIGATGGLLLAPKSYDKSGKSNFKRKLRYALLGAGIGGLGGAGIMYGGLGNVVDKNITEKQETIEELENVKNLNGDKVNGGIDLLGDIFSYMPIIGGDHSKSRNEASSGSLLLGDAALLAGGSTLMKATGGGLHAGITRNPIGVWRGAAASALNGAGRRTGLALLVSAANAAIKKTTGGDIKTKGN